MTSACVNPNPRLRCEKHRRCSVCIERDGLFRAGAVDGLTKTNSSSIVATLFGLARRGKR